MPVSKSKSDRVKIASLIFNSFLLILFTFIIYVSGGVKFVYAHIMYIPIVLLGTSFGIFGGTIGGIVAGLLIGPFMPLDVIANEYQVFSNWFFRLSVFTIIGSYSGLVRTIFNKQKNEISLNLYRHSISNIPNFKIFDISDVSNYNDDMLYSTIAIHNYQKIIETFNQAVFYDILKMIYNKLDESINVEKIISSNNSNKFWIVSNTIDIENFNSILEKVFDFNNQYNDIPIYLEYSVGYKISKKIDPKEMNTIFYTTDLCSNIAQINNQRYLVFDENIEYKEFDNSLLSEFRSALSNNETFLVYQPKVSLLNKNEIKLEALIRWNHPKRGLLPPSLFLPYVEETKLVNDLTRWVLIEVIKKIKEFDAMNMNVEISLNISAKNLFNQFFMNEIIEIIKDSKIDPSKLEFEITESIVMSQKDKSVKILKELKKLGLKLSIDDFGKGFSSLSSLTLLNMDYVKIDKSFISNLAQNEISKEIVKYTIDLAHLIGYKVICEGVEYIEQYNILKELNCDYVQGYYILRPSTDDNILKWINENKKPYI